MIKNRICNLILWVIIALIYDFKKVCWIILIPVLKIFKWQTLSTTEYNEPLSGLIQQILYIKRLKTLRIKSQSSTLHFCSIMFRLDFSPSDVTGCSTWQNSYLLIFGFTVFKIKALMHLLEKLTTFLQRPLCVLWRCQADLHTNNEIWLLQKELYLKHEDVREHSGKCWLTA